MLRAMLLVVLVLLAGCSRQSADDSFVWFVHATDPHLFLEYPKQPLEPVKRRTPEKYEQAVAKRNGEQVANARALEALLRSLDGIPGPGLKPDALVLTGDIGFGETAKSEDEDSQRTSQLVDILAKRPNLTIYWVPGNNDVRDEGWSDADLEKAQSRLASVAEAGTVKIEDLSRCYTTGEDEDCWADLPETNFRLVGFPTHSFKPPKDEPTTESVATAASSEPVETSKTRDLVHVGRIETLERLVTTAATAGKRVLIATTSLS